MKHERNDFMVSRYSSIVNYLNFSALK